MKGLGPGLLDAVRIPFTLWKAKHFGYVEACQFYCTTPRALALKPERLGKFSRAQALKVDPQVIHSHTRRRPDGPTTGCCVSTLLSEFTHFLAPFLSPGPYFGSTVRYSATIFQFKKKMPVQYTVYIVYHIEARCLGRIGPESITCL